LVEKARAGSTVVRLKGGDPFVFGRGGEEIQALQAAGIPYEEVPGISSAIAIPATAGIPVTHRGISRSLHIITGHTAAADGLPEDFAHLAALHGTLVFLMGLSHLEQITDGLLRAGKAAETPAAVVSGGNAAHPSTVRGTLGSLAERTRQAGVRPPAVIVVGEVAALDFSATLERPLQNIRIGLTGTSAVTSKLKEALREQGADVRLVQESMVEELPISEELSGICGEANWLVFTSSNGVRSFFRRLREQRVDLRCLYGCKFAAIGASTGKLLEQYGICPDLCPETYTSEALARTLLEQVGPEETVVLLRSQRGADILPRMLGEHGIPVRDIPLYTLRSELRTVEAGRALLDTLDYLTFSSASGVELFFSAHGAIPERTVCVCIGEVTAKALARRYDRPFLMADTISAEGIVRAILRHRETC
jgi:uroporphyrinogen III methyltransferase/synthase